MGMRENSTIRLMRVLVKSYRAGDRMYAYRMAKGLGVEPQRIARLFKKWEARGYVIDEGRTQLPDGIGLGPAPRIYRITELGITKMKEALEYIDTQETA